MQTLDQAWEGEPRVCRAAQRFDSLKQGWVSNYGPPYMWLLMQPAAWQVIHMQLLPMLQAPKVVQAIGCSGGVWGGSFGGRLGGASAWPDVCGPVVPGSYLNTHKMDDACTTLAETNTRWITVLTPSISCCVQGHFCALLAHARRACTPVWPKQGTYSSTATAIWYSPSTAADLEPPRKPRRPRPPFLPLIKPWGARVTRTARKLQLSSLTLVIAATAGLAAFSAALFTAVLSTGPPAASTCTAAAARVAAIATADAMARRAMIPDLPRG